MAKRIKSHGVVRVDNQLIDAQLNLTAQGKKIVLFTAKVIQDSPTSTTSDTITVRTNARAIATFLGLDIESTRRIRDTIRELQKTIITLKQPGKEVDLVLMYKATYEDGGAIELSFAKDLQPLFKDLKERYTGLLLGEVLRLRSKYALRIYEICMMLHNREHPRKHYTLEELRDILSIPKKHAWAEIKKRILEPAKLELDEKCRVSFEFMPKFTAQGKGRPKVEGVTIDVFQNKPQPNLFTR